MESGSPSGGHLIYTPYNTKCGQQPHIKEQDETRSAVLEKIHVSFQHALEQLPVPMTSASLCFGLLDPISNIIGNTITGTSAEVPNLKDMEQRSYDGLVAFLTILFPYLAEWEAVRFLRLADADLLVAARLIVQDRDLKRFDFSSAATDTAVSIALKCAALASKHTDPDHLVRAWLSMASRLCLVQYMTCPLDFNSFVSCLQQADVPSPPCPGFTIFWSFAWQRSCPTLVVPYRHYRSVKRVLLDVIHTFYLKALARLPAGELRSRYHRSMLMAGHCYGPLDPIANIIVNTIWYDTMFPPKHTFDLDMISTMSLLRIEARSFYGLLSFLGTRYQNLTLYQAMRSLLNTDANLLSIHCDPCATGVMGNNDDICDAFRAAGTAGWHPFPDRQADLLSSCMAQLGPAALSLLRNDNPLSSRDASDLASSLSLKSPTPVKSVQQQPIPKRKISLDDDRNIVKKVKAALAEYTLQNGEPMYDLHVICGVNNDVSGPEYSMDSEDDDEESPFIYHHSHVNFLASQRGNECSSPVLFFAEFGIRKKNEGEKLCCPVSFPDPCAEQVRCLYCDFQGTKIVHPAVVKFNGCDLEFEKIVCGKDPYSEDEAQYYNNREMSRYWTSAADWVGRLDDDRIYDDNASSDDDTADSDDDSVAEDSDDDSIAEDSDYDSVEEDEEW